MGDQAWGFADGQLGVDALDLGEVFGLFLRALSLELSVESDVVVCGQGIGEAVVVPDGVVWVGGEDQFAADVCFGVPFRIGGVPSGQQQQSVMGRGGSPTGGGFGQLQVQHRQSLAAWSLSRLLHGAALSGTFSPSQASST